jgi:dihydrolipoamide dehydrogenase
LAEACHVDGARQAVEEGKLDVESVFSRRDSFVDNWNDAKLTNVLTGKGIVILRGQGRLDGNRRVAITHPDGSKQVVNASRAVVLCTGSTAAMPNIPGLVEARPWTGREATSAKKVPQSLAIIGDGPVACEMAHAWNRLGSKVTILGRHKEILDRYEPFVGELLGQAFTQRGITLRTSVNVVEVKRPSSPSSQVQIILDDGSSMRAGELLVAVGRVPNTWNLGMETVGLKEGDWINVDDNCKVSRVAGGWLYAVGDINHRALLTHMGKYQARICAADIFRNAAASSIPNKENPSRKANIPSPSSFSNHVAIPQVIFTDPQVASVGLTEKEARKQNLSVRAVDYDIGALEGAKIHSDGYRGQARLVIDESRRIVVGATFVGPQVGELIHSATVAIMGEITVDRLWHAIPAFPTVNEIWIQLLESYGL